MGPRAQRFLSLVMVCAFVAGGCGSADEEDKFAEEANEVCVTAQDEIEAAGNNPQKIFAAGERFIDGLKAVKAPSDTEADYEAWVATQEKYFTELESAAKSGDTARIDALDDNAGDDQARELGLDECLG